MDLLTAPQLGQVAWSNPYRGVSSYQGLGGAAGFPAAMGAGDGFLGSSGMYEGFGNNVLGGLNPGGLPQLGLGSFGCAQRQQKRDMLMVLGMLAGLMGSQGMRGPGLGGGNPMCGPQGIGGQRCQQGGVIELTKGQSFTTPGGATINWQGDEVKVHEPGGGQQSTGAGAAGRAFGGGNTKMLGAVMAGPGFGMAMAAATGGMGGACGCGCHHAGADQKPRDWRVHGDPHIDHPDGSKSDFQQKNAMFTLNDGTRVMMGADNPLGVTQKVQVILPGAQPQWDKGYDPAHTSIMQDNGSGHFNDIGTADKFMGGGLGMGGGFGGEGFGGFGGGGFGGNAFPMQALLGAFA